MGTNASILLIDKKPGITSFAALRETKRCIDPKTGHIGTLDKFASGLLVVLTGSMTHLNPVFSELDKSYEATFRFGVETDTLDPDGTIVQTGEGIDPSRLDEVIRSQFLGEIDQTPPRYSAVHVGGERASKLMRRGKSVEMPHRKVTIHDFQVAEADARTLKARITVSKGTYIRSIARDLAAAMGSCGMVTALRRTRLGPYSVDEAVGCDDREGLAATFSRTGEYLLRLPHVGKMEVAHEDIRMMEHGRCSDRLVSVDGKRSVTYGAVYAGGYLRWVVDLANRRIICHVPEELHANG